MKAKPTQNLYNLSYPRNSIEKIIDHNHTLVYLVHKIDWESLEKHFQKYYVMIGRRGVNTRMMLGLHLIAHIYNMSEEEVCEWWPENPYWQYFCGRNYLSYEIPINPDKFSKFKKRINVKDLKNLLQETLDEARDG